MKNDIEELRKEIDRIDEQIVALLVDRLCVAKEIGKVKLDNREQITDNKRESEIYNSINNTVPDNLSKSIKEIYNTIITISKKIQSNL